MKTFWCLERTPDRNWNGQMKNLYTTIPKAKLHAFSHMTISWHAEPWGRKYNWIWWPVAKDLSEPRKPEPHRFVLMLKILECKEKIGRVIMLTYGPTMTYSKILDWQSHDVEIWTCLGTYFSRHCLHTLGILRYPLVIKHGVLENTLFSSVIFLLKPPFLVDFQWPRLMTPEGTLW